MHLARKADAPQRRESVRMGGAYGGHRVERRVPARLGLFSETAVRVRRRP
ncbi:hypothetical protein [Caballeronia grimmiae]